MKKYFNQKGSSMILFVGSFVLLLGITALVTDIGAILLEREKLHNATDAAALAGVQQINKGNDIVINTVKYYAGLNQIDPSNLTILIDNEKKNISVQTNKKIQHYFAKVLGINDYTINVESKAKASAMTSYKGIKPLAVLQQNFIYNAQYILKEDAGDGLSGNYGALALGGNGADVYRKNLLNGYLGTVSVGDTLITETGNITQATRQGIESIISFDRESTYYNFKQDSKRLIIIPVVNTLDVSGKKPITVLGFAAFFLEGTLGNGGHTEIVGRFIRYATWGDCSDSQTDYGLSGIKLIS